MIHVLSELLHCSVSLGILLLRVIILFGASKKEEIFLVIWLYVYIFLLGWYNKRWVKVFNFIGELNENDV